MIEPNEPTGSGALSSWCRRLLLWCRSIQIRDGVGYKVRRSTSGTILELGGGGRGAGSATDSDISRYRVQSVQGDYLTCHTWDGTDESTDDVYVAKPPHLRHSLTAQTVNAVAVTYSNYSISGGVCTRDADASGYATQDEMVIPQYQLGEGADGEVWAAEVADGTGVTVTGTTLATSIDLNLDARAWCQYFA